MNNKALEENFKGPKDTSYGVAGDINYEEVDKYLIGEGYKKEKEFSKGRYYILKISKEGTNYIFKMSSSEGINFTLLNEKSWNDAMYEKALKTDFLRVPKVEDAGNIGGFEFIVTEFFEGPRHVDVIEEGADVYLGKIVDSNFFIDSQNDVKTYKNELEDKEEKSIKAVRERAEKYIEVANNFVKEVNDYDLSELLKLVEGFKDLDQIGLNHNEFEPYNYIVNDGIIHLYHGERASARSPRFFDVAVMYSKLYYTYGKPDLAKKYLKKFVLRYDDSQLDYFKFAFKTMLASRVIGGYWDYARNYENDIELLERLKKNILNDELFNF